MTTVTIGTPTTRSSEDSGVERKRLGTLALFAAVYTYALIVFGGIVRITGSGMGCGDDWPRCNGEWIPAFTFETVIEYTHRLLAAGIGLVVLAVFLYALMHRRRPGIAGAGGALHPLAVGAALLVFQVALGAITVRLELPTGVTVAHFITAMLFMATLVAAAVRAGAFGNGSRESRAESREQRVGASAEVGRRAERAAWGAVALGLLVVSLGALTANTPGAPQACRGFPLCTGAWVPPGNIPGAHLHWTHRLLAILLLLHVAGAVWSYARRGVAPAVRRAASAALGLIVLQIAVAIALVVLPLPAHLQATHLAVGAAVWFALVVWVALAGREVRASAALP